MELSKGITMRKPNIAIIFVLCLFGISLTGCGAEKQNQSNISKNINGDSETQKNEEESWIEDTPDHVYHTVIDNADLAVNFDSYDDVIAASEFVVTGTVQKIKSYMYNINVLMLKI